jgi:anti-sigma regulatory factor (Ser/Thr protein kinase)
VGPLEPLHANQSERRLDLRVRASPEEVLLVRHALGGLGLPDVMLDDATLLVSELLTNSIRHSGLRPDEEVRVTAEWSGQRLRVTVRDRPAARPAPPVAGSIRPPPGAESGWGLFLVDQIASQWGTLDDEAGGGYWFELKPMAP